jgi:hypothetical protein
MIRSRFLGRGLYPLKDPTLGSREVLLVVRIQCVYPDDQRPKHPSGMHLPGTLQHGIDRTKFLVALEGCFKRSHLSCDYIQF